MPGNSGGQIGGDDLFEPHQLGALRLRIALALGLGGGGERHELGQGIRHFQACKFLLAGTVADSQGQVQTQVRDMRKRASRVEGQRRQHRKDSLLEVLGGAPELGLAQIGVVEHEDVFGRQRGHQLVEALAGLVQHALQFAANGDQLSPRTHAVRADLHRAGLHLSRKAGDPDHEKFVEVGAKNGEELHALQQRIAFVFGLLEYAPLEGQQAQFTIDVQLGVFESGLGRSTLCRRFRGPARGSRASFFFAISPIKDSRLQCDKSPCRIVCSSMDLPRFLLDEWLEQKHNAATPVDYDLGSSTGPVWTLRELLSLGGDLEELLEAPISYVSPRGTSALREAIASLEGCDPEYVQATTGGAEALLLIFSEIAVGGRERRDCRVRDFQRTTRWRRRSVLEARHYVLRPENGFRIDAEEIRGLIDANTRLVLVNSPHNPTGATLSDSEMEGLHDFCAERGVQFLSDQVYHPIYHDGSMRTAARLPHATVLGDFSKALCLSGMRIGWIVEPDAERRTRYLNARSYFTVCGSAMAERLGALALRQREAIYARARKIASENLARLAGFFADRRGLFHYAAPRGGMTAFPSMADGSDARPLCAHALRQGASCLRRAIASACRRTSVSASQHRANGSPRRSRGWRERWTGSRRAWPLIRRLRLAATYNRVVSRTELR